MLIFTTDLKLEEDTILFKDYKLNHMYNYKTHDGIDNRLYSYLPSPARVFIAGTGIAVGSEEAL